MKGQTLPGEDKGRWKSGVVVHSSFWQEKSQNCSAPSTKDRLEDFLSALPTKSVTPSLNWRKTGSRIKTINEMLSWGTWAAPLFMASHPLSLENMASNSVFIETPPELEGSVEREISWWNKKCFRWQQLPSFWVRGIRRWCGLASCSRNTCWSCRGGYLVQQCIIEESHSETQLKYFGQTAARGLPCLLICLAWRCVSDIVLCLLFCLALPVPKLSFAWEATAAGGSGDASAPLCGWWEVFLHVVRQTPLARHAPGPCSSCPAERLLYSKEIRRRGWEDIMLMWRFCSWSGRAGAWGQRLGPRPHRGLHWCHLVALTWKEPHRSVQFLP